jgi:putative ABC transport system permease protein
MSALVLLTSRRDLSWRRRRLAIAVAGTTLAFALALLLSGFREGIDVEASRTVDTLGADTFIVRAGASGPFTTVALLDAAVASDIGRAPGVTAASPIVSVRHAIDSGARTDVYLIGAVPGGLGMPTDLRGRAPARSGEAALGGSAGRELGDRVRVGGRWFDVVGLLPGVSVWANVPVMFVPLGDAQDLVFDGRDAATAILLTGTPPPLPSELQALSPQAALRDLKRPLANAVATIDLFRILLWVVAAAIVGSILYISALERSRDFAVFKAFGTRNRDLVGTLVVEAVAIAASAAALAIAVSRPMAALFPAVISFPARTLALLPPVALLVGFLGALAGARRAISVDPAQAFSSR